MPEAGLPAVLAGQHDPARPGKPVVPERPQRAVVVQLVVLAVLERAVGVDAGLVSERVAAHPGLVLRERLAERVARPPAEPPGPGQVDPITDLGLARHPEAVPERENAGQQVGVAGPLADAVDAGVHPRVLA